MAEGMKEPSTARLTLGGAMGRSLAKKNGKPAAGPAGDGLTRLPRPIER